MIDLTDIIVAIITLIITIISRYLVPLLKNKVDAGKLSIVKMWVRIAVQAAEMIYNESGQGAKKKEYVLSFLEEKGFRVKADEIDNLIESAVLELKK